MPGDDYEAEEPEGGESACFAHLLCPICGGVMDQSHRDGCPSEQDPAGA